MYKVNGRNPIDSADLDHLFTKEIPKGQKSSPLPRTKTGQLHFVINKYFVCGTSSMIQNCLQIPFPELLIFQSKKEFCSRIWLMLSIPEFRLLALWNLCHILKRKQAEGKDTLAFLKLYYLSHKLHVSPRKVWILQQKPFQPCPFPQTVYSGAEKASQSLIEGTTAAKAT